jgi:hypothetical protein
MFIRKFALILVLILWLFPTLSVHAQSSNPPNYQIRVLSNAQLSADEATFTVNVAVLNIGGDATAQATVQLYPVATPNTILAQNPLTALRFSEVREVILTFAVRDLPAGEQTPLGVRVLLAEELQSTLLDNTTTFSVTVPLYDGNQNPAPIGTPAPSTITPTQASLGDGVIRIPILNIVIDLNDSNQRVLFAGILIGVLLLLFIVSLIFRVLFRKTPLFGSYKPPYSTVSQYDRNSTIGRRQLWQQHAQNNSVQYPCRAGTYHARKLLLGMNGRYLDGWKITALRMMQYDMYGRITRSQVLSSQRWVKRLNRTAHRGAMLKPKQISRRVAPVAKWLDKQFKKRLTPKTALLSIALDIRLQGTHGEVRIVFELHECHQGMPALLDQWDPDMIIVGRTLHESYTFTLNGQNNTETYRQFRKRLRGDIQQALTEVCQVVTVMRPEPIMSPPNFLNPPTHPTSTSTERGFTYISPKTPTQPITERIIEVPTEHNIFSIAPPPPNLEGWSDDTQQSNPMDE